MTAHVFDTEWEDEPCQHDHDEECFDGAGNNACLHQHCFHCGGCTCPGYCDDYQTYNLRDEQADTEADRAAQGGA